MSFSLLANAVTGIINAATTMIAKTAFNLFFLYIFLSTPNFFFYPFCLYGDSAPFVPLIFLPLND